MRPTLKADADFKLLNAATEMIRLAYTAAIGEALSAAVKHRLTSAMMGEDGRKVRTGGVLTGRMWRGWRSKPSGRTVKSFFGGSSISSRWILAKKMGEMDDDEIKRLQKGGATKMTWLTKQRGVEKVRIRDSSGKWIVRTAPDTEAEAWEKEGHKRSKPPKVRNRIKAASVQWGNGNTDYKARSFLGLQEGETMAALEWLMSFIERTTMKGGSDFAHSFSRAEQHNARVAQEIRRRARR